VGVAPPPPLKGGAQRAGDSKKISNPTHNLTFLTARAHYINGVGYYEQDSIVQACAEYLKTLELMESHFEDKALIDHKARFMALTYGRLGEMFNEQLLAEPAIVCYKQALYYCKREPTSIYGIPVLLYNLGIQFDVANQKDSAAYYYDEALLTFSCVPRVWTMVSRKNYIVVQVISDDVFYVAEIDEKHRLELRNLPWDLVKANLPVYGWIVVVNDSDMIVKSRKVKLL
jgi:tetratricopeptide (TPR) repeat protein